MLCHIPWPDANVKVRLLSASLDPSRLYTVQFSARTGSVAIFENFVNRHPWLGDFRNEKLQKSGTMVELTKPGAWIGNSVEGLYSKRPIQCLASSVILTPHTLTAGECVPRPPAPKAGGGHMHSLGGEGVGRSIVPKTPDTALYSIYVSTLWVIPNDCLIYRAEEGKLNFCCRRWVSVVKG